MSARLTPERARARQQPSPVRPAPAPLPAVPPPPVPEAAPPVPRTTEVPPLPLPPAPGGRVHRPPYGRRARELARRKAAKFQAQVAAASSLDDPPLPPVRARKAHCPPHGRRALEIARRKAAKFQAQVATPPPALPAPPVPVEPEASARPAAPLSLPVPHPTRARRVLSSPRGQRALELAMRKAAEARATAAPPAAVRPAAAAEAVHAVPASAPRRRLVPSPARWRKWAARRATLAWAGLAAGLVATAALLVLCRSRGPADEVPLAGPRPSLQWLHQAQDRAADGSFRLALDTVERALADSPDNAALLRFKGDMHQSLLEFGDAQAAYEQALRVYPSSKWARENLVLSRRLSRAAARPAEKLSTLYGLHRAMLAQGRIDEAIAISNQLPADFGLLQRTWQAALDRTGLRGRVTVDDQGVMSLDLSGSAPPDLTLIQKFPVRRLYLSGTGLQDLRPLAGLPLESLDLSYTPVYDLTPLRGMPLEVLRVAHTGVVDLTPLKDCPLRDLDISGTRVAGVEALARMPLASLRADGTPVTDLRPLAALPLVRLSLSYTRVADLRPLAHLGVEELILDGTNVVDLTPLKGSALRELSLANTPVADLSPLAGTPLGVLTLQGCRHVKDLRPLLSCAELEHLRLPPDAEVPEALRRLPRLRFLEGGSDKPADAPAAGARTK